MVAPYYTQPNGCAKGGDGMEVVREIELESPPEEVWEAITEPERLEEWFANDVELDPRPGGEGRFRWANGEERRAVVEWLAQRGDATATELAAELPVTRQAVAKHLAALAAAGLVESARAGR